MDALSTIELTNRYGETLFVEKELVHVVSPDSVLEGDGSKMITLRGARVYLDVGSFFVTEHPRQVFNMLCGSEDAEGGTTE